MSKQRWNEVFAAPEHKYGEAANLFLVSQGERFRAGQRVLCLGEGQGRNACWLAGLGLDVTAVDFSVVALQRARELADKRGVRLAYVEADLEHYCIEPEHYDIVTAIFVHLPPEPRRRLHQQVLAGLRPGGWFIGEFFSPRQLAYHSGGPREPELLYAPEDLQADFAGAHIELLGEQVVKLDEGAGHQGQGAVTRIVARRP